MFGFWLPLYQFVCGLISAVVGHSLLVAKLVSAVSGTGVCLLVYAISLQLTANRPLALLAFAFIAVNPVHIMYSAFSLTDVPHALLVLGGLYFAIRRRWIFAAALIAVASLMRVESWLFIPLLPALQFLVERKVSLASFCIAVFGPLLWLYICWNATGNPLEYFRVRSGYVAELVASNPDLGSYSIHRIAGDLHTLIYAVNPVVIGAAVIAVLLPTKLFGHQPWKKLPEQFSPVAVTSFLVTSLGFLLVSYFTNNQPAIFARYGLIIFALGLPVLFWTLLRVSEWRPAIRRYSFVLAAFFVWQMGFQIASCASFLSYTSQKRAIADCLRTRYEADPGPNILCDDWTVRVLSGVSSGSFITSDSCPGESKLFLTCVKENGVHLVVFVQMEGILARPPFSELDEMSERGMIEQIMRVGSRRHSASLYRFSGDIGPGEPPTLRR